MKNASLAGLLLAMATIGAAAAAPAADAWWNDAWGYRLKLTCKAGEGDVAVAARAAGRADAGGRRDLRLVDADSAMRPFELIHHDPNHTTLLQFLVGAERGSRHLPLLTAIRGRRRSRRRIRGWRNRGAAPGMAEERGQAGGGPETARGGGGGARLRGSG